MKHKIILSRDFEEILDNVNESTREMWQRNGLNDKREVLNLAIDKLNNKYKKLEIYDYEFREKLTIDGGSSTYFGCLENEDNICDGYISIIPPNYSTRSGVLAQQVFPALTSIMMNLEDSKDNKISNRPIFIINMNEVNFTGSMAVNVYSGYILNFGYVDIYNRNVKNVLMSYGMSSNINSVVEYDKMLKINNRQNINEYFEIDNEKKIISFLPNKLKNGININNEPYWFSLRAYAALYLAIREGYTCNMSKFEILKKGNKTLDVFRKYINRF